MEEGIELRGGWRSIWRVLGEPGNCAGEKGPGPELHPCRTLGRRCPVMGPFHRRDGPDSILSCLVGRGGRKGGGRIPKLLAWAANDGRYLLQEGGAGWGGWLMSSEFSTLS